MPPELAEWVRALGPFAVTIAVAYWLMSKHEKAIEKKDASLERAIGEFRGALDVITTKHEEAFKKMAESQEKRDAAYESLADKKIIAILELGAKVETLQTAFREFKAEQLAQRTVRAP